MKIDKMQKLVDSEFEHYETLRHAKSENEIIVDDLREIIVNAKNNAIRSVDFERVQMYWKIGQRIIEEEQGGAKRAEYGKSLIANLSTILEPEFGTGFSKRVLWQSVQFYKAYPIVNALRSQLDKCGKTDDKTLTVDKKIRCQIRVLSVLPDCAAGNCRIPHVLFRPVLQQKYARLISSTL